MFGNRLQCYGKRGVYQEESEKKEKYETGFL